MSRNLSAALLALVPWPALAQEPTARADAAGDPLPPGAVARLGTARLRHPDWARSLAASADGKTLASAGEWHVRLWELPSGRPLKALPLRRAPADAFPETAPAVAFTAAGDLRALAPAGGGAILYDPASGKEVRRFPEPPAGVLSGDGAVAAFYGEGRSILRGTATGEEAGKVPSLYGVAAPLPAALSADGQVLAVAGRLGVRLVDTRTGRDLAAVGIGRGSPDALALSPDGKTLAAAVSRPAASRPAPQNVDTEVVFLDAATGKRLRASRTYNRYVRPLAFSGDGKVLAAGLGDMTYAGGRTIVLLDPATGKEVDRPVGHQAAVRAVAFVAGTAHVRSACDHDVVRTWEAATGKPLGEATFPWRSSPVLSPDGKLAALGDGRRVVVRDLAADREVRAIDAPEVGSVQFSADGKYLAGWSEANRGRFAVWEVATGKELPALRATEARATFAPDSTFLVRQVSTDVPDCRLEVVDLPTGKVRRHFTVRYDAGEFAVSPDGKRLAVSHRDQALGLWDLAKGERVWAAAHPARDRGPRRSLSFAGPVALSPDGRLVATGGDDETVRLWEAATGKEVRRLAGHQGAVLALAFSADGKRLASASEDTTVLVWDVADR